MATVSVVVDCTGPGALAAFWSSLLGYEPVGAVGQYCSIHPSAEGAVGPKLIFQAVAEGKTVKNRLHLDVDLDPGLSLEPEVDRAVGLGAVPLGDVVEEFGLRWQVLADPEGNEFCIIAS